MRAASSSADDGPPSVPPSPPPPQVQPLHGMLPASTGPSPGSSREVTPKHHRTAEHRASHLMVDGALHAALASATPLSLARKEPVVVQPAALDAGPSGSAPEVPLPPPKPTVLSLIPPALRSVWRGYSTWRHKHRVAPWDRRRVRALSEQLELRDPRPPALRTACRERRKGEDHALSRHVVQVLAHSIDPKRDFASPVPKDV